MKFKNLRLVTILISIIFALNSQAQNPYAEQNLKQSTDEELVFYLDKAKKLKTTGIVLTIAAPVAAITGLALSGREANFPVAFPLLIGSPALLAAGIPVYNLGSSRVKKVSRVWNSKHNQFTFRLSPCTHYNYQAHYLQPGLALKISF